MAFEKVSDNGVFLYGLDPFRFQIYQTVTNEKISDNGVLLHGLDIFRFQISIHTLKLDVPKKYSH